MVLNQQVAWLSADLPADDGLLERRIQETQSSVRLGKPDQLPHPEADQWYRMARVLMKIAVDRGLLPACKQKNKSMPVGHVYINSKSIVCFLQTKSFNNLL